MGSLLRRLLFFFRRKQFDRDLDDELRFHEEMKAHALADAEGMSGDEARAAARRRIGSPLRLREQSREPWIFATVETFAQDVRHALRLMRRAPAFTFTALATLALGIGLNTAIVSVAYGVLWRPLPYPDADRLVIVSSSQQTETGVRTFSTWPPVSYEALRTRVTALDHLAAYAPIDAPLTGRGEPLQVPALEVSPNFFATLGVGPARGRAFLTGAAAPDDDRSAIVSDRLWRTSLEADPAIVGQSITIDGLPRTVVGVLPPDFSFRPVIRKGALPEADIFLPNRWPGDTGRSAFLFLLGRLKPGVTQERAEAELTALVNDPSVAPAGALGLEGAPRAERPQARARGRLAGVRLGVGAHAAADPARGGVVRAADRLRQRRAPADGAPHRAPGRTVRTHGPRRGTPADRAPVADGSGRVVAGRRVARRDARADRDPRHAAPRAAIRASPPRRHRDRRARDGVLPRLVARLDSADRPRCRRCASAGPRLAKASRCTPAPRARRATVRASGCGRCWSPRRSR